MISDRPDPVKDFADWGRWLFEYYRETEPIRVIGRAIKEARRPNPASYELAWVSEALHRRRKNADRMTIDAQADISRFALKYAWIEHCDGSRVKDDDRAAWLGVKRRAFLYQVKQINDRLIACAQAVERDYEEWHQDRFPGKKDLRGEALVDYLVGIIKSKVAERQEWAKRDAEKARAEPSRITKEFCIHHGYSLLDDYRLESVVNETVGFVCESHGVSRSAVYRALKTAWERGLIPEDAGYKPRANSGLGG